jgi:hypothetical protein
MRVLNAIIISQTGMWIYGLSGESRAGVSFGWFSDEISSYDKNKIVIEGV